MIKSVLVLAVALLLSCVQKGPLPGPAAPSIDRHLKNVTQLTFDGDNGEAYFSHDGKKLIFQSKPRRLRLRQDLDHEHRRVGQADGQPGPRGEYLLLLPARRPEDHLLLHQPYPGRLPARDRTDSRRPLCLAALSLRHRSWPMRTAPA